jgi:alpha-tubulin suppressor-like RCC1 family protein/GH24 family phage-related lysozyme (muramidase)
MKRLLLLLPLVLLAGCGGPKSTAVTRPATIPRSEARPDGYKPAKPPVSLKPGATAIPQIDVRGLRFIEGFEGFSSCPYRDTVGTGTPYTRGYGETEGIGRYSPCISPATGEQNLKYRLERFYGWAIRGLGVSFNQSQVDALYSFVWNLGAGIFTGSLRTAIQHHNPYPLLAYDHAQGRVLEGLARRRRAEVALFLSAPPKPAPLTPAQRRALLTRIRVLHRVLGQYGCTRRRAHHQKLGPTCLRWFAEGDRAHHALKVGHFNATAPSRYLVSWGQNNHLQLCAGYKSQGGSTVPIPTPVPNPTEAVTGGEWGAALTESGEVWTCGGNEQGQAANGAKAAYKATPSAIPGLSEVAEVSGSGEHMMARLQNGTVEVWGSDYAGQECDGNEGKKFPVTHPKPLAGVSTAVQVDAGGADDYVLLADGTVLGCGENHKGQLGDGTTVNKTHLVTVQGLSGIKQISSNGAAAVGEHLLAVTNAGTVVGLGLNDFGQLGNGNTANASHPVPAAKGLTGVRSVSAGPDHDLAVLNDGTVWAWGQDTYGQLGSPATTVCGSGLAKTVCSLVPKQVPGFTAGGVLAAGTHFSLVTQAGRLFSFGQNRYETLANGSNTDVQAPTLVSGGLENVTALAAGYFNGFAVTTTHATPEVSVVAGKGSLTLSWVSGVREPWHVVIRPVTVPVGPFGKSLTLPADTRSHTFTGLAPGAYEVAVDARQFRRKLVTGIVSATTATRGKS